MASQSPGDTAGNIRAVLLPLRQNIERKVLKIHKIDHVPLLFFFLKAGAVFQGKRGQCPDRTSGRIHHGQDHLSSLPVYILFESLNRLFLPVPHSFYSLFELPVIMGVFFSGHPGISRKGPSDRTKNSLPQLLKPLRVGYLRLSFRRTCCRRIAAEHFPDLFEQASSLLFQKRPDRFRSVGLQAEILHGGVAGLGLQKKPGRPQNQRPHPGGSEKLFPAVYVIVSGALLQPCLR